MSKGQSMNWISLTLLSLSLLILCTMLRRDADILSPGRIFGFTWSFVFALANLKLSRLQLDWTSSQWMYALFGPLWFLLGIFVVYTMNVGSRLHSPREMRSILKHQEVNEGRLFSLIMLAFFTYVIGYAGVAVVRGQIPLFSPNPSAARTEFMVFGIALFIANMTVIVFLSTVYLLFVQKRPLQKKLLVIISTVTLITYLFLLQRYQLLMVVMLVFTFLYYGTRFIRPVTVSLFTGFGIVAFYFIATLRAGQIIQLALYKTSLMKFSYKYAIFTEPYMYIVMNVENFINSISKLNHYSFGYFTFDWIFALLQLKYPMREYFGLSDTPITIAGYNTYTMFWTFYRDFGILGISLVPFIGGLAIAFIYYALRRNPTIGILSLYCILVFVMALSFFVNPLGFLWFIYVITWILLSVKYVSIRPVQQPSIRELLAFGVDAE